MEKSPESIIDLKMKFLDSVNDIFGVSKWDESKFTDTWGRGTAHKVRHKHFPDFSTPSFKEIEDTIFGIGGRIRSHSHVIRVSEPIGEEFESSSYSMLTTFEYDLVYGQFRVYQAGAFRSKRSPGIQEMVEAHPSFGINMADPQQQWSRLVDLTQKWASSS